MPELIPQSTTPLSPLPPSLYAAPPVPPDAPRPPEPSSPENGVTATPKFPPCWTLKIPPSPEEE
jgi:hypothetical protein